MRGMKNGKFWFMLLELRSVGTNEHVSCEGVVPSVVVHDSNGERFREICTAVEVLHEEGILG